MIFGEKNLKQVGLKITQPRLKILHIFENSKQRHLSADDIHRILQQQNQDVSIATIYRVLGQFESAGILQRLNLGRDQAVYELESDDHHDHMTCVKCHKVEEFFDPIIENRQQQAVADKGAKLIGHSSVLYIECANCLGEA